MYETCIEPWTNAACLGYVISALEKLDYSTDEIWRVTAEMKELFDWLSLDEAKAYYCGSPY